MTGAPPSGDALAVLDRVGVERVVVVSWCGGGDELILAVEHAARVLGLATAMELTANRRPFLYFPLKHHFEQNFHVRHRLERYRAGRMMDSDRDGPEEIAAAIATELGREVDYQPVESDGAARAALLIAEML